MLLMGFKADAIFFDKFQKNWMIHRKLAWGIYYLPVELYHNYQNEEGIEWTFAKFATN